MIKMINKVLNHTVFPNWVLFFLDEGHRLASSSVSRDGGAVGVREREKCSSSLWVLYVYSARESRELSSSR